MPRPIANPPNPWLSEEVEYLDGQSPPAQLDIYEDRSRTILSKNDSPDLSFDYSVNPYRGCYHGCSYCYARTTHEYLGFGAGTDFERRLLVKPRAPELLREAFEKKSWQGAVVMFSGATDCYQPLEVSYRLTRGCLEVCAEYKNPVGIVTKAPLIERDLDLLVELHQRTQLTITISIPMWDEKNARAIEPFVASPRRRMRTIQTLADAGLLVGINVSPLIPAIGDRDIARLLREARAAGARYANSTFLRLPGSVRSTFETSLRSRLPLVADHTLSRIREARGGALNNAQFGQRMRGEGAYAASAKALFDRMKDRLGFEPMPPNVDPSPFERPRSQLSFQL